MAALVATRETQGNWFAVAGDGNSYMGDQRVVIPVERSKGTLRNGSRVVMTAEGPKTVTQIGFASKGEYGEEVLKRKDGGYDAEADFDSWTKTVAEGSNPFGVRATIDSGLSDNGVWTTEGITLIREGVKGEGVEHEVPEQIIKVKFGRGTAEHFTSAMRESINTTESPKIRKLKEADHTISSSTAVRQAAESLPPRV